MKWNVFVFMALGAAVCGQGFGAGDGMQGAGRGRAMGRAEGMREMAALRESLGLSDAQMQQLRDLRREQFQAARPALTQMREKQRALGELMRTENPDPGQVGQLMVESKKLRESMKTAGEGYRAKAQAVLTAEQKTKLSEIETARGPAERQARAVGLLAPPVGGMGRMGRQRFR